MAQVGHVASNSGTGSGSSIAATWGASTGAGNCGVFICCFGNNDQDVDQQLDNPPSGWRLASVIESGLDQLGHSSGNTGYVYVYPNLPAGAANPTFTRNAGSDTFCWWLGEYENVDHGDPIRIMRKRRGNSNPTADPEPEVDTQVGESLTINAWCLGDNYTGGTISTESPVYVNRALESTTDLGLAVYDRENASRVSTGNTTFSRTATNNQYGKFDLTLQPARSAVTVDIKTYAFRIQAPATTQLVNYTDPGFDVKAIRIMSVSTQNTTLSNNSEFSIGLGADDGVTTKAQGVVGFWHDENVANERGWSDDTMVVKHYNTGTTSLGSPDFAASYSKITNGFSLDWTAVGGTAHDWIVVCYGGADYRAKLGIGDLGSDRLTSDNPWRANAYEFIGQCVDTLTTPQIRTTAMLSFGFATEQGQQVCFMHDYETEENFNLRNTCFMGQIIDNTVSYEAQAEKFGDDKLIWQMRGGTSDEFFYLAHNFTAGQTYPDENDPNRFVCQLDIFRMESGNDDDLQSTPPFDDGGPKTLIVAMSHCAPQTRESYSNAALSMGAARVNPDDDSIEFQEVMTYATNDRVNSDRKRTAGIMYGASDGRIDLTTNRRESSLDDFNTIRHDENIGTDFIIAFWTFGEGVTDDDVPLLPFFGPNH
jgi:hypothetical protein